MVPTPSIEAEPSAIRKRIESAGSDLKKLSEVIASALSVDELNIMANALNAKNAVVEQTKTYFNAAIDRLKIREQIEEGQRGIETNLEALSNKYGDLVKLLNTKTETAGATASGWKDTALAWMGTAKNYVIDFFKPKNLERTMYGLMASPALLGMEKIWGINRIVDFAKRKIAMLDIRETIEKTEGASGIVTFNGICSDFEWLRYKTLLKKDSEVDIVLLTANYLEKVLAERKKNTVLDTITDTLTLGKIMNVDESVKQIAIERSQELKKKVEENQVWKDAGMKTVEFGTETSMEGDRLKAEENDFAADGTAKSGSKGEALLKASKELPKAGKIIISTTDSSVILNWSSGKAVTLPKNTDVPLAKINALLEPKPDSYGSLVIAKDMSMSDTKVVLRKVNGIPVLFAQNNASVLEGIAQGKIKGKMLEEKEKRTYEWKNVDFIEVVEAMAAK